MIGREKGGMEGRGKWRSVEPEEEIKKVLK